MEFILGIGAALLFLTVVIRFIPWPVYRPKAWWVRLGKLVLLAAALFLAGLPLHDLDIFRYPGKFFWYVERYLEFVTDPLGAHFEKTRIEVTGGSWRRGYTVERFDGRYWRFARHVEVTGSGTAFLDPPPAPAMMSGEAVPGQERSKLPFAEYRLEFLDLDSQRRHTVDALIVYRLSDRQYSLQEIRERQLEFFLARRGKPLIAYIFQSRPDVAPYVNVFLPDEEFAVLTSPQS